MTCYIGLNMAYANVETVVAIKTCPNEGCLNELHPLPERNAVSRRDNETYICAECGVLEVVEDYWQRRSSFPSVDVI